MSFATNPAIRVLVTGFGPFPGIPSNASASVARALETSTSLPDLSLGVEIIPVLWGGARAMLCEAVARVMPHAILHFGVSKRASAFEIETRACNITGSKKDHAGVIPPETSLDPAGKLFLTATLPPYFLLDALTRDGFPAAISHDAGRYLCNALFYWSLCDAKAEGRLVSFVHMPAFGAEAEQPPRLTMDEAVAGARILVRAAAEAVLRARGHANPGQGGPGFPSGLAAN